MSNILKSQPREAGGKLAYARSQGLMPAVVYSSKHESTPIFLNIKEFQKVFKDAGYSGVVDLKTEKESLTTLIHDVSYDARKGYPVHADFLVVDKKHTVKVNIPIEFVGEAPGEKNFILVKVLHELEVEALPNDLPQNVSADLSILNTIGDHILISNIKLPKGVNATNSEDSVVASLTERQEESEDATIVAA